MSDFSLFSLFTAGLACMIPLTAAYTKPVGDQPKGNPISQPGLNSVVPVGKPFTITWQPTTPGTVTLVLLKGPSSNAVPQYPIVEKTENNGSYVWTPKDDLEPTDNAQGYGIQLIDDATGQYQYTTQFGISNPDYKKPVSSSSSSSSSQSKTPTAPTSSSYNSKAPYPTETPLVVTAYTTYCPEKTTLTWANYTYTTSGTITLPCPGGCTVTAPYSAPKGTGVPSYPQNITMVAPTGSVPSTLSTASATSPIASATYQGPPAASTGGASSLAMSFFGVVAAGGAAVLAI
ncbi:uncharacterized protein MYCFIDRAFT_215265 [Pseudocercospora fijiensis CIRAD86]|uniref:Yeast cell wall synthesis Kre9/Knh1-like N-terminal domain-containing protein n=1 Tax=Pseudocercospora fijiensis (strain CIRAD86) TaxID=383855 RepID=M3B1M9_PSEFD|nr:uncharacterized protein MYCFIDRAFT_215265 [Pseudocercospora fijiensis CIRAD86]EME83317.1 hypothetical protein MYCFIDRAFT_215265 [Pseudocercospora fijiensis CIRAD86]